MVAPNTTTTTATASLTTTIASPLSSSSKSTPSPSLLSSSSSSSSSSLLLWLLLLVLFTVASFMTSCANGTDTDNNNNNNNNGFTDECRSILYVCEQLSEVYEFNRDVKTACQIFWEFWRCLPVSCRNPILAESVLGLRIKLNKHICTKPAQAERKKVGGFKCFINGTMTHILGSNFERCAGTARNFLTTEESTTAIGNEDESYKPKVCEAYTNALDCMVNGVNEACQGPKERTLVRQMYAIAVSDTFGKSGARDAWYGDCKS